MKTPSNKHTLGWASRVSAIEGFHCNMIYMYTLPSPKTDYKVTSHLENSGISNCTAEKPVCHCCYDMP